MSWLCSSKTTKLLPGRPESSRKSVEDCFSFRYGKTCVFGIRTSSDHLYSEQQSLQAQRLLRLFTTDIDFTRQGVEQTTRFTSCSRHRLHTSTSRGRAARSLRDSLRAQDIDFTRQGVEQPTISDFVLTTSTRHALCAQISG